MKIFAILLSFMLVFGAVVLSQEEEKPVAVKQVAPFYPTKAKDQKIEGTVWVIATITTEKNIGYVSSVVVKESDNELLNEAAMDAMVQWTFKPLKKEYKITVPFKFKLSDSR